jgi:propanediol dehydratase small subunit
VSLQMIKRELINEIDLIPDDKILEVYNFIHYFRLGTQKVQTKNTKELLSYAGSWKEMDDEVFDDYMLDIVKRRKKAFSGRRNNETSTD